MLKLEDISIPSSLVAEVSFHGGRGFSALDISEQIDALESDEELERALEEELNERL